VGIVWRASGWTWLVCLSPFGLFYGHLVILWSFGNFVVICYIFPCFGLFNLYKSKFGMAFLVLVSCTKEKSGNPGVDRCNAGLVFRVIRDPPRRPKGQKPFYPQFPRKANR
jgi:hypothetical protein